MNQTADEIFERLRDVEDGNLRNTLGLQSHEKECAIRYAGIQATVASIRGILMWFGGGLLTGMAAILVKLLFFPHP